MKLFGTKYRINWKYSQKGNLWKIVFAGKNIILGETRNPDVHEVFYFAIDFTNGKPLMKNFEFEKNNFWVTLEDAADSCFFLSNKDIYQLRENTINLKYDELYDYPVPYDESHKDIIGKEITEGIENSFIEFIERDNILIFNYYKNKDSDLSDLSKKNYVNTLCIYNKNTGKQTYKDVLNENTSHCVPDNFFIKDNYLFYIREKKELININLSQ